MDQPAKTSAVRQPAPAERGKGRPRIYCSDHCRQLAYEERVEDRFHREPVQPPRQFPAASLTSGLSRAPSSTTSSRTPTFRPVHGRPHVPHLRHHLLENPHYQHAINELIVTFFMIGRMSNGTYQLPIVV